MVYWGKSLKFFLFFLFIFLNVSLFLGLRDLFSMWFTNWKKSFCLCSQRNLWELQLPSKWYILINFKNWENFLKRFSLPSDQLNELMQSSGIVNQVWQEVTIHSRIRFLAVLKLFAYYEDRILSFLFWSSVRIGSHSWKFSFILYQRKKRGKLSPSS